jgi:hypothetical protein
MPVRLASDTWVVLFLVSSVFFDCNSLTIHALPCSHSLTLLNDAVYQKRSFSSALTIVIIVISLIKWGYECSSGFSPCADYVLRMQIDIN